MKEIEETKDIENKVIDMMALHRNELTHEIECEDIVTARESLQKTEDKRNNNPMSETMQS